MKRFAIQPLILVVLCFCVGSVGVCAAQESDAKITVNFVDSAGMPVSNVKATWYRNGKAKKIAVTDGSGTIASNAGMIVAKSEGHQFSGTVLNKETTTPLSLVMLRDNEAGKEYETQPLPFSADQKQRAIGLIEASFWDQLKSNPTDQLTLQQCVPSLAKLSPDKALEYFATNPIEGQVGALVKQELIKAIVGSKLETAVELADSADDPMHRAVLLMALVEHCPPGTARLAVETEFANAIKSIPQSAWRLSMWATLAEHYQDTDRPELAEKIISQNLEEIEKLPSGGESGLPRSMFAALIAVRDPDAALELIEGMDKRELNRALGRIAFHCCRNHPEKAIELAEKIKPGEREIIGFESHVKICHRMAVEHPDAAFKLAAMIEDPNQEAWALGMMALRLHQSKSDRAREALSAAIEVLSESNVRNKPVNTSLAPSNTLAGLLPIAKKVAPEKMNSMIWQAVHLAIPRSRWNLGNVSKLSIIQTTASQISRYDRSIATAFAGDQEIRIGMDEARTATNQVALDIDSLAEFLIRMEQAEQFRLHLHWSTSALLLTDSESDFWDAISKPGFLEWPSDSFEDF